MIRRSLGPAHVVFTDCGDGDMGHGGAYVDAVHPDIEARRRGVVDLPWTWLRQVHGDEVVHVREPGEGAGSRADAAITSRAGCALAVLTADCAPVALASPEGVIGVVHAGWKGVLGGVLQRSVKELRALGATTLHGVIGPCIRADCYRFGEADLARLADRYGAPVTSRTASGEPALDLPAAVRAALAEQGVDDVDDIDICTSCSSQHFSWRGRREQQRQAAVVWR